MLPLNDMSWNLADAKNLRGNAFKGDILWHFVGGQGGQNYFLPLQEDLWYSEKSV